MGWRLGSGAKRHSRRAFMRSAAACGLFASLVPADWATGAEAAGRLAFRPDGAGFRFDTGVLEGQLRAGGRSVGLGPVVYRPSGASVARGMGLFSHYRLLDDRARYGHAAWDWPSGARLLDDAAVEVRWQADDEHPLDMTAVYRWVAPNVLDLETTVVAGRRLRRFEVFLASYFDGFPRALVYVRRAADARPGFLAARPQAGIWQMFPRDDQAVAIVGDGRWRRPPNPVDWQIMPPLAAPLAVRRDPASGLAGLVMAPPSDCFAVATPYGEEPHRSLYLSLFGVDLQPGRPQLARARLIIDRDISDQKAVALFAAYVEGLQSNAAR